MEVLFIPIAMLGLFCWQIMTMRSGAIALKNEFQDYPAFIVEKASTTQTIIGAVGFSVRWLTVDLIFTENAIIAIHYNRFFGWKLYQPSYIFYFNNEKPLKNDKISVKIESNPTLKCNKNRISIKFSTKKIFITQYYDIDYKLSKEYSNIDLILKEKHIL